MSNLCKWRFFHPYFDIRITRTAELWPLRAGHLYLHEIPWYLFLLKAGWAPGLMNSDRKNRSLEDFQESLVHIFLSTFMYFLYIFRATMCPSSGETTVFMWHLVLVILYGLLSGIQSGTKLSLAGGRLLVFMLWAAGNHFRSPPNVGRALASFFEALRHRTGGFGFDSR